MYAVNYDKLQNLKQIKYYLFILGIIFLILFFIIFSLFINVNRKVSYYGVFNNGMLNIKINIELSDEIKKNHILKYNNENYRYEIQEFGDIEIVDNKIMQDVKLNVEGNNYSNEVGLITFNYHKQKLCKYILELFI